MFVYLRPGAQCANKISDFRGAPRTQGPWEPKAPGSQGGQGAPEKNQGARLGPQGPIPRAWIGILGVDSDFGVLDWDSGGLDLDSGDLDWDFEVLDWDLGCPEWWLGAWIGILCALIGIWGSWIGIFGVWIGILSAWIGLWDAWTGGWVLGLGFLLRHVPGGEDG